MAAAGASEGDAAAVNVLMAADHAYARPLCVALASLARHSSRSLAVYVVDCGLTEADRLAVVGVADGCAAASAHGVRVEVTWLSLSDDDDDEDDASALPAQPSSAAAAQSRATWARIFALERRFLPVERVVYLDADVLVRGDIAGLWNVDLKGQPIAAVLDVGLPRGHAGLEDHGWDCAVDSYLNAGVLVLDLPKLWPELPRWTAFCHEHGQHLRNADQDVVNLWVRGRWLPLPATWNAQGLGTYAWHRVHDSSPQLPQVFTEAALRELEVDCNIVHFTGSKSPRPSELLNEYATAPAKPWGYWRARGHPFADEWHAVSNSLDALLAPPGADRSSGDGAEAGLDAPSLAVVGDGDVRDVLRALKRDVDDLQSRLRDVRSDAAADTLSRVHGALLAELRWGAIATRPVQPHLHESASLGEATVGAGAGAATSAVPTGLQRGALVVVTGGAGFIGPHVVRALVKEGYRVRVADDMSRGSPLSVDGDVELLSVDLTVPANASRALEGADAVIHLAARVAGCPYVFSGDGTVELDTWIGTERVDGAVIAASAKSATLSAFIYVASACSYPQGKQQAPLEEAVPLGESDLLPAEPESGYGWAKLSGELKARQLARVKQCRIVRLHNVYGPGMRYDASAQVVPALVHRGLTTEPTTPLEFGGSGQQFRDFLHVDDAVRALLLALRASPEDWPSSRCVPFGTGVGVTIRTLAEEVARATGHGGSVLPVDMVEGDRGRVCDTAEASRLGWTAAVPLSEGVASVVHDVQRRLAPCLAVGLPLTSKGKDSEEEVVATLRALGERLPVETRAYVAVDDTDPICASKPTQWYESALGVLVTLLVLPTERPFPAYRVYNQLFRRAYDDGMEFFVLLGDDVRLSKRDWLPDVRCAFRRIQRSLQASLGGAAAVSVPFGVGVVAIPDDTSPGFPCFPVVHRWHAAMMGGRFCPDLFVNQDADPWVWEVYRRIGAAVFLDREALVMSNTVGGALSEPRYERQHVDWKFDAVHDHTVRALQHLGVDAERADRVLRLQTPLSDEDAALAAALPVTLDVVVPSYRVNVDVLRTILSMRVPQGVSTLFIVVIDNPQADAIDAAKALEAHPDLWGRVRVRVQPTNMGVSEARNRGVRESAAQWVLFIDDDVTPSPSTLEEYAAAIKALGTQACGFVGPTRFPPPTNLLCAAVHASHLTYFWGLPANSPMTAGEGHPSVPWGVTANLVLRRTRGLRFDPVFPRTGGGEDIAACLDVQRELALPLLCAPKVDVTHPWWDGGRFSSWRFFAWTQGDGLLMDMYPQHRYRCPPNAVEATAIVLLACVVHSFIAASAGKAVLPPTWWLASAAAIWAVEFAADGYTTLTDASAPRGAWAKATSSTAVGFWLRRVATSALATVFKNHVELGHLWVQLKRARWANVCARFDWHCGQFAPAVGIERRRVWARLFWTVALIGAFSAWSYGRG